jgi:hypothetical protein
MAFSMMGRFLVVVMLPLLVMPLGCVASTGGGSLAKTAESEVGAEDISRIGIKLFSGKEFTLEASAKPSGVALLVVTERRLGRVDSEPRTARDTLRAEEWAGLIEIVRTEGVLTWRPSNAHPPPCDDCSSTLYIVGGESWSLKAYPDKGSPGGIGFARLAERLGALARAHGLDDEFDFLTRFGTAPPQAEDATTGPPADASDLLSIAAKAFPPDQDPSEYGSLGDDVVVFGPERLVRVRQRHDLDSQRHFGDEQGISASEWDALVKVVESDRLMEWLPPKPDRHPRESSPRTSSGPSPVHYSLTLSGPGWVRIVVVPATEAGALKGLLRRMVRLAEDRTPEALLYFGGLMGSGENAP